MLNAVVHKDYSSGIPIQISVYEHQIVLWNPGQLPQNWTLEKLLSKHPSHPYNPLLANAFFRAGYIESWGRGIEKINRECREHGIDPPLFDYGMSGLMVTFRANPQHLVAALGESAQHQVPKDQVYKKLDEKLDERLDERLDEKLSNNRATILRLMTANSTVTVSELAAILKISRTATDKNIQMLKSQGYLERIGPAKGGHWNVKSTAK